MQVKIILVHLVRCADVQQWEFFAVRATGTAYRNKVFNFFFPTLQCPEKISADLQKNSTVLRVAQLYIFCTRFVFTLLRIRGFSSRFFSILEPRSRVPRIQQQKGGEKVIVLSFFSLMRPVVESNIFIAGLSELD